MSTGTLFFKRKNGEKILIKNKVQENEVGKAIHEAVANMNPNYKIYYMRYWQSNVDSNVTVYDVGSYTEFFLYEKDEKASS